MPQPELDRAEKTPDRRRPSLAIAAETRTEPSAPDEEAAEQAAHAAELLQAYLKGHNDAAASLQLSLNDQQTDPEMIALPAPALDLLREILAELANGHAVTVAPARSELTTQQAADMLNVSRPYLVRLLDKGHIPFRRVGNRRRVMLTDILNYRSRDELHRQRLLDELAAEAEDLSLKY